MGRCVEVQPLVHCNLGSANRIQAWEAGYKALSFRSRSSQWCMQSRDSWRGRCAPGLALTQGSDLSLPPAHLRHWVLARSIILSEISSALSKQLNNPWGSQGLLCLGSRQLQGCSDAKVHSPSPNEYIWYRVLVLTSLLESKLTIDYKCHMMEINISRLTVFRILNWQTMN